VTGVQTCALPIFKTVPESQIVETLIEEAMKLAEEMGGLSGAPVVTTS
jgi:(E)-4-hydroxy-3-methylbut-2-enyl-diphosphate synthase